MIIGTSSQFVRPSNEALENQAPYDVLKAILDDAIFLSGKSARRFEVLYYGLRVALIILSACAAAKGIQWLINYAPLLSLLVAIGTTIDTWLQPGVKYKAHYTYNDKFRALRVDLHFINRDDSASLKTLNERWKALDDEYRKTILPV